MKLIFIYFYLLCLILINTPGLYARSTKDRAVILYSTNEFDLGQNIRYLLVASGMPFKELRFNYGSESGDKFITEVVNMGYFTSAFPLLTDKYYRMKYLGDINSICVYLLSIYARSLIPYTITKYSRLLQVNSYLNDFMFNIVNNLRTNNGNLPCGDILNMNNSHIYLGVIDDSLTNNGPFIGSDYITFLDITLYSVVVLIELVSPGCIKSKYLGIIRMAKLLSNTETISTYENSQYFRSLIIPGTNEFVEPVNFFITDSDIY
ncbi:hypothetical protein ACR3K2_35500 [Cryptosporidium serpentis]